MLKNLLRIKIFISLFVLFFIPQLVNAKIKIEVDLVTGKTKISSIIYNPKNPLEGIIFTFLDNKYWLAISKEGVDCWFVEHHAEILLESQGEWKIHRNLGAIKDNSELINHNCTITALVYFDSTLADISKAESVTLISHFRNKDSIIVWELTKDILNEWKTVADFKDLKKIDFRSISVETTRVNLPDSASLILRDDSLDNKELPPRINEAEIKYPESARQKWISGQVILTVLIDKEGKVKMAKVAKSSDHKILDKAALKAAYKNIYKPAIGKDGNPVAIWIYYPVNFMLSKTPPTSK